MYLNNKLLYRNYQLNSNNIYKSNNTFNNNSNKRQINIHTHLEKYIHEDFKELKFENNVINIKNGVNYKIKTLMHGYSEVKFQNNRAKWIFAEAYPDVVASEFFQEDEFIDINRTNDLVGYLTSNNSIDDKLNLIRIFFPKSEEVGARLQNLGLKVGTFQIKGDSEKLFLDTNGWIFKEDELEGYRQAYLERNFFEWGHDEKTKFMIDGKEFHLDSTGHLNIPEGTICTPARVKIIN